MNYNTCLDLHKDDADFFSDEWRLYLGKSHDLWADEGELIKLIDENGKTLDSLIILAVMDFDKRVQTGDIILKRSFDPLGHLFFKIFPDTVLNWPSGRMPQAASFHNGIVGTYKGVEGIFESRVTQNFIFTPWKIYSEFINKGIFEVKIARLPGLSGKERQKMNDFLSNKAWRRIVKYNVLGAIALGFDMMVHSPIIKYKRKNYWYCTQVVSKAFSYIGKNCLGSGMPSPETLEQLVASGELVQVAEYFKQPADFVEKSPQR